MRLPAVVIAIAMLLIVSLTPAQAQTVFGVGVYEFENTVASMTYSGTWATASAAGYTTRNTNVASSSVSFLASGSTLVIWRILRAAANSMNVCVGASCTLVTNTTTGLEVPYPTIFTLPAGTQTITITQVSGGILLDSFMILSSAAASFPTPVPTATIIPSPTPASTTTPQPTPTPQPSSTPISVIWAIDPEKSYGSANGQITSMEYTATAADIQIGNLLTMLLFSVWGIFFFGLFVLVRYKKK